MLCIFVCVLCSAFYSHIAISFFTNKFLINSTRDSGLSSPSSKFFYWSSVILAELLHGIDYSQLQQSVYHPIAPQLTEYLDASTVMLASIPVTSIIFT